jgi:hypothetical protein
VSSLWQLLRMARYGSVALVVLLMLIKVGDHSEIILG